MDERLTVEVEGGQAVSLLRSRPASPESDLVVIYAPGAGSNLLDPFGAFLAPALAEAGTESWRFQFPYMEAKRGGPDRPPVLEATWRSVLALRQPDQRIVAGGRSMGGRIASQVAAGRDDLAGLALFAYPLHSPGRPESKRDQHFSSIRAPTLLCSGTRDAYASPDELAAAASLIPASAVVHLLEGADHGFNALKASGRTRQDVWAEATSALLNFLQSL